jgi:hypothetical protein
MIALSDPADKSTRAQVAEAVSLVAAADFPEQWSDLIDVSGMSILILVALLTIPVWLAIGRVIISHGLQYQHWCLRDCAFHLPTMARASALRRTLHHHQLCPFAFRGALFETFASHCISSPFWKCWSKHTAACSYGTGYAFPCRDLLRPHVSGPSS